MWKGPGEFRRKGSETRRPRARNSPVRTRKGRPASWAAKGGEGSPRPCPEWIWGVGGASFNKYLPNIPHDPGSTEEAGREPGQEQQGSHPPEARAAVGKASAIQLTGKYHLLNGNENYEVKGSRIRGQGMTWEGGRGYQRRWRLSRDLSKERRGLLGASQSRCRRERTSACTGWSWLR